jgi:ribosome-associated protein
MTTCGTWLIEERAAYECSAATMGRNDPVSFDGATLRRICHHRLMQPLVVRGVEIPAADLHWRFSRSSGPGGQSVNTSDSRVELSFDLAASAALQEPQRERALAALESRLVAGVITVVAAEHRSQWRNRQTALARLQQILHDATAPPDPKRRPTRPSRAARQRRLDAKRRRGDTKRLRQPPGD